MLTLDSQIESVLFVRTEGVTVSFLSKVLGVEEKEIKEALEALKAKLEGSGIKLLVSGENVLLTTHPAMSGVIESIMSEQATGELTPASLQTLSIILYKGGATKADISYIRGVDARMSLRSLSMRGLIEKSGKESYRATVDTLRFLGIGNVKELPRFKDIQESLSKELRTEKE